MSLEQGAESEVRTIWRQGRIYGLGNAVNRFAGLLLIPILVHVMSTEEWGAYALILLAAQFLTIVPGSLADSMDRLFFDHEEESERGRVVTTTLGLYLIMGLVLVLLAWPISWLLGLLLFGDQSHQASLLVACLAVISELFFALALHYLRLRHDALFFVLATLGRSLCHFGLSILFVVGFGLSVFGVILGQALAVTLACLPLLAIILRRHPWRFDRPLARELLGLSLPLAPAWLARNAFPFVERALLDLLAGVATVGIFSFGSKLAEQLRNLVTTPFDIIWGVRLLERGDSRDQEQAFHRVYVYYLYISLGAALGLSLFAPEVVRLLAPAEYWEAWKVVPLLAAVQILISVNYHFEICLLQRKETLYLPLVNGLTLAACVLLLYLMIPAWGMLGAAVGILLAQTLRLVLAVWSVARCSRYHRLFPWTAFTLMTGKALLVYLAALALAGGEVAVEPFLVKALLFLVFAAAAFLGPAFTGEERRVAYAALRARLP